MTHLFVSHLDPCVMGPHQLICSALSIDRLHLSRSAAILSHSRLFTSVLSRSSITLSFQLYFGTPLLLLPLYYLYEPCLQLPTTFVLACFLLLTSSLNSTPSSFIPSPFIYIFSETSSSTQPVPSPLYLCQSKCFEIISWVFNFPSHLILSALLPDVSHAYNITYASLLLPPSSHTVPHKYTKLSTCFALCT